MVIEKIRVLKILLIQILVLIFLTSQAVADFTGPFIVVEGAFGEAPNEFAIEYNDMGVSVPSLRSININGNIFVVDKEQVKIFDPEGHLLIRIKPKNVEKTYGWPAFMDADSQNNIYTSNYDQKLQKYSTKGTLLWEKEVILGRIAVQPDDTIFIWGYRPNMKGKERFVQFFPNGEILKTYAEKPLALGVVERKSLGKGRKEVKVKYPDKEYIVKPKYYHSADDDYLRDQISNLYAIQRIVEIKNQYTANEKILPHYRVIRFDYCDESPNIIDLPINKYKVVGRDDVVGERKEALAEYGKPVVALKGDIYTWKRTPDTYSIIKWTWQGEPDAPQSLRAVPSKTGITLTWEVPRETAESVDEYEINRSADVCGPFRPIATVKKNVLTYEDQKVKAGETYYYQVRAIRDKTPSGYSNKAIGKR